MPTMMQVLGYFELIYLFIYSYTDLATEATQYFYL